MQLKKPSNKDEFYEDAGDLLADFRKQYPGAVQKKKNSKKNPFDDDPDVIQAERQTKLEDQQKNNLSGLYGY